MDRIPQRGATLPISETHRGAPMGTVTCLILIGQSYRPDQPAARIIQLQNIREVHLGRGEEDGVLEEEGVLCCTLADRWMSNGHAVIKCFPMGDQTWCVLEDRQSTNGCRVNGVPVTRRQLQHDDIIETGQTYWKLYQRPEDDIEQLLEIAHRQGEVGPTSSVSPVMLRQVQQMRRIAATEIPVVVMGDSGTGKEVMTSALHEMSGRTGKLVALNCAAIPSTLMESELFGHRKGAFTGAYTDKRGVVEEADGGTLFLDEVGDTPLDVQAKLLRLLQERSFVRVGDTLSRSVDVRFIAATNRDLEQMVQQGTFRGDLFARLNGFCLQLPSLRERREDIGLLLAVFLRRSRSDHELSIEAYRAILAHPWPYNIRELEKAVTTAVAMAAGSPMIRVAHLPAAVQGAVSSASKATGGEETARAGEREAQAEKGRRREGRGMRSRLVELLTLHDGNVAAVARELATSRAQIHRWMQRAGVDPAAFRRRSAHR